MKPAAAAAALLVASTIGCSAAGCAHDGPLVLLPWLQRFDSPEGVVGIPTIDGYRYIVPVDGGVVLVDAGFAAPTPSEVEALLGRPVLAVFITHAHLDHVGGVGAYDGVPIYIGKDELPLAAHDVPFKAPLQNVFRALVPFHGLPRTVTSVDDGGVVVVGGRAFVALFLRGHTRGSTAWLVKRVDDVHDRDVWLFAGDALLGGVGGDIGLPPALVSDDTTQALRSLQRLAAHPFRVLFDGHGGRSVDVWRKIPRFIVEEARRRS